jgi:hypothetical protein
MCGRIDRIDMTVDVYVEVSHIMYTDMTPSFKLKGLNLKKKLLSDSYLKYYFKKAKIQKNLLSLPGQHIKGRTNQPRRRRRLSVPIPSPHPPSLFDFLGASLSTPTRSLSR